MLNLAVCPPAACASLRGAKVPHAIAKWAVRPSAASARISGGNAQQRQAESQQIKHQGLASCKGLNVRARFFPSASCTGLTGRSSGR
jgi:hypothetical protein